MNDKERGFIFGALLAMLALTAAALLLSLAPAADASPMESPLEWSGEHLFFRKYPLFSGTSLWLDAAPLEEDWPLLRSFEINGPMYSTMRLGMIVDLWRYENEDDIWVSSQAGVAVWDGYTWRWAPGIALLPYVRRDGQLPPAKAGSLQLGSNDVAIDPKVL